MRKATLVQLQRLRGQTVWSEHDSLEELIEEWDWGSPRIGAHYWNPNKLFYVYDITKSKFLLLYIENTKAAKVTTQEITRTVAFGEVTECQK